MAASRSEIQAGRASVSLGVKNEAFLRGLAQAKKQLQEFGQAATAVGQGMLAVGGAFLAPVGVALKRFADFDDQMRQVQAVAGATDQEFKALTETAKNLGATTSFSAAEVAGLMAELGRAGFNPEQIEGATGAILDMARAAGVDAPRAAEVMGNALNQFGLGADQARRVADALALTSNVSATGVNDLGEALSYTGKVAADSGMSIEDTLAILASLGNVGIKGSSAGTTLQRLLTITGAEAEKLQGIFGVAFTDSARNARPLVDVLAEVAAVTKDMPTAERTAKMAEAFGLLGITGAGAIGQAASQIRGFQQQLADAEGSSEKAAKKMDAGLGGAFRRAVNAADALSLAIGGALESSISRASQVVNDVLGGMTRWVETHQAAVETALKGAAAFMGSAAGLVAIGTAAKAASFSLTGLITGLGWVGKAGAVIGGLFTPWGAAIGGVAAAAAGVGYAFYKLADPVKALAPVFSRLWESIRDIGAAVMSWDVSRVVSLTGAAVGDLARGLAVAIKDMVATTLNRLPAVVDSAMTTAASIASAAFNGISNAAASMWPTIKQVVVAVGRLAGDVFDQLPQIAGYAVGRVAGALVDAFTAVHRWINETMTSIAKATLEAFANLGPRLIQSMISGDFSSVANALTKTLSAAVQRSAIAGAAMVAGFQGQAAPGFELSQGTRDAFSAIALPNPQGPQAIAEAAKEFADGSAGAEKFADNVAKAAQAITEASAVSQFETKLRTLNQSLQNGSITSRQWRDEVAKAKEEILGIDPMPLAEYAKRVRVLHEAFAKGAVTGDEFAKALREAKEQSFGLEATPLQQYATRLGLLDQAFYAGAVSLGEYRRQVAEAKQEILGLDAGPLAQFAERARVLREQLAAGAITQQEFARSFRESQKEFLGLEENPIDSFVLKIGELRQALAQGLITPQMFQAGALEALPEKVKSIIDETRTPMEKYRKELAELDRYRSAGLIDQRTYDRRKQQLQADTAGGSQQMGGSFSAAALIASARGQGAASPQDQIRQALRDQAEAQRVNATAAASLSEEQRRTLAAIREFLRNQKHG